MTPQSIAQPNAQIELILQFIEALHIDPGATPPPGLDAADIAFARDLARTYPRPTLGAALRQRIWQRALAEAVRERLEQGEGSTPVNLQVHSNGRYARQETEPMSIQQSARSQPMPRRHTEHRSRQSQRRSRGIPITGLVAALITLVIGGLLFVGPGMPPDEPTPGAGSLIEQDATPTPDNAMPPLIQAVMDIDIRQGPGLEYPVMLTLTEGSVVTVVGRTEDSEWHQVLLPDGTKGWIATPTQGESPVYLGFGDLDEVPVIGATEDTARLLTATPTPIVPSASNATPTPLVPPSSYATATPVTPPPSIATTTPMVPPPSNATPTPVPTVAAPSDVAAALTMRLETWNVRQISEQLRFGKASAGEWVWSPNGDHLAVASDNRIMLYKTGELRASLLALEGHAQPVIGLAYHPTGTLLASSSADGTVRVWDAQAGDLLTMLRICDRCDVERVAFNPDGSVLIIEAENDVLLWGLSQ